MFHPHRRKTHCNTGARQRPSIDTMVSADFCRTDRNCACLDSLRIENVPRSNQFPRPAAEPQRNYCPARAIGDANLLSMTAMSQPLLVSIPHRLGREEATRRLKAGLGHARANYAQWLTFEDEAWNGDSLQFRARALGQVAAGRVDVFDDHVQLEVTLPWLLAKFAEKLVPAIRKEGTLMLEKK